MKGIVLEIRDGYAAILRADGIVEKRRGQYQVGETIEIARTKTPAWRRGLRAAVAAVALVGILSAGGYSYQNVLAYSYVSLDVGETSIEYTLNRRDQVIGVSAMNDCSGETAEALRQDLLRQPLTDALEKTVDYLDKDLDTVENYARVSVTSGSSSRAEKLANDAGSMAGKDRPVEFDAKTATREERRAAEEAGMSTGRWQLREQMDKNKWGEKDFRNGDMDDLRKDFGPREQAFPAHDQPSGKTQDPKFGENPGTQPQSGGFGEQNGNQGQNSVPAQGPWSGVSDQTPAPQSGSWQSEPVQEQTSEVESAPPEPSDSGEPENPKESAQSSQVEPSATPSKTAGQSTEAAQPETPGSVQEPSAAEPEQP